MVKHSTPSPGDGSRPLADIIQEADVGVRLNELVEVARKLARQKYLIATEASLSDLTTNIDTVSMSIKKRRCFVVSLPTNSMSTLGNSKVRLAVRVMARVFLDDEGIRFETNDGNMADLLRGMNGIERPAD